MSFLFDDNYGMGYDFLTDGGEVAFDEEPVQTAGGPRGASAFANKEYNSGIAQGAPLGKSFKQQWWAQAQAQYGLQNVVGSTKLQAQYEQARQLRALRAQEELLAAGFSREFTSGYVGGVLSGSSLQRSRVATSDSLALLGGYGGYVVPASVK